MIVGNVYKAKLGLGLPGKGSAAKPVQNIEGMAGTGTGKVPKQSGGGANRAGFRSIAAKSMMR